VQLDELSYPRKATEEWHLDRFDSERDSLGVTRCPTVIVWDRDETERLRLTPTVRSSREAWTRVLALDRELRGN
jgi:hypothetical protein